MIYSKPCNSFDGQTLAFNGASLAYRDPLTPGQFNLPANATFVAVPESWPEDKWPFWANGAWELKTVDVPQ